MLIRVPHSEQLKSSTKSETRNEANGKLFVTQVTTLEPKPKKARAVKQPKVLDDSLEVARKMKELFSEYESRYKLVTTEEELIEYMSTRPELGFDTETDGLDRYKDIVAGFSIGNADDCIYVPLNHKVGTNYTGDRERLKEILTADGRRYWGMNTKFDRGVMIIHCGFDIPMKWDGEIAARLIDNREEAKLKAQYILHIDPMAKFYEFKELFKQSFTNYDPKIVGIYGGIDAMKHYILGDWQKRLLEEHYPRIYKLMKNVELPLVDVVLDMELYGIAIDTDHYSQFDSELEKEAVEKLNAIQKEFPNFNPNSPKQVAEVLFDRLRLPDPSRARKTGEGFLEKINHWVPKSILEIRKLSKARSTYTSAIPLLAIKDSNGIPIIHTTYHTIGADCVVGNTIISCNDGLSQISDIVNSVGNEYKPLNKDLINMFGDVESTSHCIKFEQMPTKKVITKFGFELEGTLNHPVMTQRGWITLDLLNENDFIAMPINYKYNGVIHQFPEFNTTTKTSAKDFKCPKELDEDFAEFIGMFHADGSIRSNNGSCEIRLANKNKVIQNRFKYLCLKLFGVVAKLFDDGCVAISKNFLNYSNLLPSGAFNKQIPQEILKSPQNIFAKFLLGRSLDSSVNTSKGSIAITLPTKQDANYVRVFLLSVGILSNIKEEKANSVRRVKTDLNHTHFYRVVIPRFFVGKYIKLVGYYKNISKQSRLHDTHHGYRLSSDEKNILIKVSSIFDNVDDVYDFTLPKTHSFIGNGFICHNTGRFSSTGPNLQNQPRDNRFRRGFVARPGCRLVSCDFSQQEQAVLAGASRDPKMLEGAEAGKDYYALFASIIWDLPYETCTKKGARKDLRNLCKSLVLGITYGMSANSLAESLNANSKDHVFTVDEAKGIMDKFLINFPQVASFKEWCHEFATKNGYMEDMIGRRRYFKYLGKPAFECPDNKELERALNSLKYYNQIRACLDEAKSEGYVVIDNRWRQGEEMRQTVNHVCQGTAASQTKICMIALYNDETFKNKYKGQLLLQVHDELIAEFPEELAEEGGNYMAQVMSEVGSAVIGTKIWCEPDVMSVWSKS